MLYLSDKAGDVVDATTGDRWTGEELSLQIQRRAALLNECGAKRGDVVLVYHGGSPAFFADLFACWQIGATAACLNPGLTSEELVRIVRHVDARMILVNSEDATDPIEGTPVIRGSDAPASGHVARLAGNQLDDVALLLFTSGTTGTPKGVAHTHRSLLARVALNSSHIGPGLGSSVLCPLPTHFGHGLIGNCLTAISAGANLVLAPGTNMKEVSKLGGLIDQYAVNFMSSVPTYWKMALRVSKPPAGGSLKRVHVGSAPLSSELWKSIITWSDGAEVVNMYGITETANWISGASSSVHEPEDGLIGTMWGGTAAIMDEDGQIHSTGEGELIVQTPSLMQGYFGQQDLTEAALFDGWFRTGDVGNIDQDGVIRLTGRKKYEISRGGLKIYPEDIDLLLERHDSVAEACAFSIPDKFSGEIVGVAICPRDSESFDLKALRSWASERLSKDKLPDRWFLVAEIPKTDRGKINRTNVAEKCLSEAAR